MWQFFARSFLRVDPQVESMGDKYFLYANAQPFVFAIRSTSMRARSNSRTELAQAPKSVSRGLYLGIKTSMLRWVENFGAIARVELRIKRPLLRFVGLSLGMELYP